MPDARYPIGKFHAEPNPTAALRAQWLDDLAQAPAQYTAAINALTPQQMDTPYREGGWTARQVVHHVADSHMQSYARFRFALTEDTPLIKPYAEDLWAELPDARTAPPEISLSLLEALHHRWVLLLRSLSDAEWQRAFRHPQMGGMTLEKALNLYSWHGRHHLGHLRSFPH